MSGLPQAVQDAAKKAREMAEQLAREKENTVPTEEEEVVEDDETELEDDTTLEEEEAESEDEESEEDEEESEDIEIEEKASKDDKDYKQLYKVLQGKYNAEVPYLSAQLRAANEKIRALQESQTKTPDVEAEFTSLKPEDFEDYGEEFTTLVKAFNDLQKRNAQLEKLAANMTVSPQQAAGTFESQMDGLVPNWREINNDNDFITWLQEPDGYSGHTKHETLLQAYNSKNVQLVSQIFKAYPSSSKIGKKTGKKEALKKEVQPSSVKTEKVVNPKKKGGRVWKRSEIKKFFKESSEGKLDPKEAAKIRADIFAAQLDGRVID